MNGFHHRGTRLSARGGESTAGMPIGVQACLSVVDAAVDFGRETMKASPHFADWIPAKPIGWRSQR